MAFWIRFFWKMCVHYSLKWPHFPEFWSYFSFIFLWLSHWRFIWSAFWNSFSPMNQVALKCLLDTSYMHVRHVFIKVLVSCWLLRYLKSLQWGVNCSYMFGWFLLWCWLSKCVLVVGIEVLTAHMYDMFVLMSFTTHIWCICIKVVAGCWWFPCLTDLC